MGHIDTHSKDSGVRHPEWYAVGSQIAQLANSLSGRSDIIALASPVAGSGAPACYKPNLFELEVNTDIAFGRSVSPEMVGDINERGTQYEFPVATGAVMHEAFHARFSRWNLEEAYKALKADEYNALELLEESRIESMGLKLDTRNRAFLRSCALEIVVSEFNESQADEGGVSAISALVALIHGRIIGAVLERDEVVEVCEAIEDYLGLELVEQLSDIIRKFIVHENHSNLEDVYPLAVEWASIVRHLKEERGEESESEGGSGIGETMEKIAKALSEASEEMSVANYSELADQEESEDWKEEVSARQDIAKAMREHKKTAGEVFGKGTGPQPTTHTSSTLMERRKPNPEERISAVKIARELERAKYRERDTIEVRTVEPSGRLRTRAVIQGEALKAKGVRTPVEAWRKKVHKTTDEPSLTVGVMVDISGSMHEAMEPMATTAWVMSEATRRVQGKCAMVYYGQDVFATLKSGQHLTDVTVYSAPDGTEKFDKAFKALNGELNLLDGNGARLLVVVSDGVYTGEETRNAKKWVAECERRGVAVVWIPFINTSESKDILRGTSFQPMTGMLNPTEASTAIGQACAKALTAMGKRNE